jgi:riboflavin biosynthesis pyrimidine reductase
VLRAAGMESILVEGGAAVITALLLAGLVDRVIVGIAPIIVGNGTEAVGDLGITEISSAVRLERRTIVPVGEDVLLAWDVVES